MYRLVIAEKSKDPYGKALEILGSYNPYTKDLQAKNERIKYWLSKGSQMSPSVNNLLIEKGVIEGEKVTASKSKKKKKTKKEDNEKGEEKTEAPKEDSKPADVEKTEEKPAADGEKTEKTEKKTEEKPEEAKDTKEEPKKE